ncbi:MAG TPA: hypothetical protein VMU51_20420 [Mycobacteriales bacterium]|nr:hypothetical protein [Mycobacteriales bacterium]
MDDVQLVRAVLPRPELTEEAAHRGRRQLQERIDAGRGTRRGSGVVRRSRPVRRRAGLTAVTVGLAAAVAVPMGAGSPAPGTAGPSQVLGGTRQSSSPAELSGRDLLLAAAATAASRPDGVGRYWHVVMSSPGQPVLESWTERNGVMWVPVSAGRQVSIIGLPGGFGVAGDKLTFRQLQQLPEDPAALRNWIARSLRCSGYDPARLPSGTSLALTRLLYDVPAPAGVRTAALQALAALPGIEPLGPVTGGEKLVIPIEPPPAEKPLPHQAAARIVLVIDPATSLVHSYTDTHGTVTVRAYEWTDRGPAGIPGSGKDPRPPAPTAVTPPSPACR